MSLYEAMWHGMIASRSSGSKQQLGITLYKVLSIRLIIPDVQTAHTKTLCSSARIKSTWTSKTDCQILTTNLYPQLWSISVWSRLVIVKPHSFAASTSETRRIQPIPTHGETVSQSNSLYQQSDSSCPEIEWVNDDCLWRWTR